MRTAYIQSREEFHFWREISARIKSEIDQAKSSAAVFKELLEIVIILLILAALFAVVSICTIQFAELCILLFRQTSMMPVIFEM